MKRLNKKKEIDKNCKFVEAILIGILIIELVVIIFDTPHIDNAIKCNNIKGEYCTDYEIERFIRGEYK